MIDLDNNKIVRKITGSGDTWRIFWRLDDTGKGLWHRIKFHLVAIRIPFVIIMVTPVFLGLGFTAWELGNLTFLENGGILKLLLMIVTTFALSASACLFNEWYGDWKTYNHCYQGQMMSGGCRVIVDGILTSSEVFKHSMAWLVIGLFSMGSLIIMSDYNPFLIVIFLAGVIAVITHDWLKAHGLLSLLAYFALIILPMHGMYILFTGNFPPLILWVLSAIESLWLFEWGVFPDMADYECDIKQKKTTVYVKYGINKAWVINRSLAFIGSIIFILAVIVGIFPVFFLIRVVFWLLLLPIWSAIDRNNRKLLNTHIELPMFAIVLGNHAGWLIWTVILILMV